MVLQWEDRSTSHAKNSDTRVILGLEFNTSQVTHSSLVSSIHYNMLSLSRQVTMLFFHHFSLIEIAKSELTFCSMIAFILSGTFVSVSG